MIFSNSILQVEPYKLTFKAQDEIHSIKVYSNVEIEDPGI